MAINDLGIVRPGSTILIPFATYDSNDPSDSVIISAFALADIGIYKGTSMTERGSTTGVVLLDTDGINIDGAVGIHGLSIDLSSNATADFYNVGDQYYVTAGPFTADAASTLSAVVATFRIGYPGAIHETNIATLASQTSFTLDAGSADDDAYNGCTVYIHAIASAVQVCFGYVSDYDETTGTLTVTLKADPGIFTIAAGDNISFFPPGNVQAWLGTTVAAATAGRPDVNVVSIFNSILPALILERWLDEGKSSTADSGTTTTLVDASLSEADDLWIGALLVFTTGTNNGYTAVVTDFDAAADTLTFFPAMPNGVTTEDFVLLPGLGHSNVQAVAGTPQTAGDIIATLGGISGATGGSVSIGATLDNVLTDISINNGGAAVDKGTSPATVGIPVTGHGFIAGQQVTLALTVAYNNSFTVDSVSTNEVVIVSSFTGETFGPDDTISSTVKTVGFIGSQQSGTFASTEAEDGTLHDIDDTGNDIDIVYTFRVGGGRVGTEIMFAGFVQGNSDIVAIEVYDHVGDDWEVVHNIAGTNGTVNSVADIPLLLKHTGTGSDLGDVYIRFDTNSTTPSNLSVDRLLVEAVNIGQTAGYQNGAIWVDTANGTAGTENFVSGTADNPVLTWADALTLSAALGITDFHIINGSTITLSATSDNYSLFGDNWTLDLNGQQIAGAHFEGAKVSGTSTGTGPSFIKGEVGSVTLGDEAHIDEVSLTGTITLIAGVIHIDDCHHATTNAVILDFGAAVGSTTVHMHGYEGSVETQNMGDSGTDIMHLDGHGTLLCNANGAGGTVHLRGIWKSTPNNATIIKDDLILGIIFGIAETGTLSTTQATSDLAGFADNQLIDRVIIWTSGDAEGEATDITDYASASGLLTFTVITTAPANGDTFKIV